MQGFATLLDRLVLTPQRNVKLRLLVDYFRATPDPDRGYALAALTGDLDIPSVKPAMLRAPRRRARRRSALRLFLRLCRRPRRDHRAGLAGEARAVHDRSPRLAEVVERLQRASRSEGPRLVESWLDELDATGRWALIKLVTGGLRIGVSARLAKQALADLGGKAINEIEEVWHGLAPPYAALFAWLEGRGERPEVEDRARRSGRSCCRTRSPTTSSRGSRRTSMPPSGSGTASASRRSATAGVARLYTRTGDDISGTFPDLVDGLDFEGAIDGELLIGARRRGRLRPRLLRRPAAAPQPQDRLGEADGEPSGLHPRL